MYSTMTIQFRSNGCCAWSILRIISGLIILFSVLVPTNSMSSSDNGGRSPSYCDVDRDDIRFFGSGGDAGRVELCHESTWRYVCSSPQEWSLATANVACRQLGYRSAFMANTASAWLSEKRSIQVLWMLGSMYYIVKVMNGHCAIANSKSTPPLAPFARQWEQPVQRQHPIRPHQPILMQSRDKSRAI